MSHLPTDVSAAPAVAGGSRPATASSLRSLLELGQSLWLDDLRRSLFTSGEFSRLIAEDGLRGVTSNPSIFERALADGTEYRAFLRNIKRTDQINPQIRIGGTCRFDRNLIVLDRHRGREQSMPA